MIQNTSEDYIAVTGSPNTTNTLTFDVLAKAINSPLDGALVEIHTSIAQVTQVDKIIILGQIIQAETTNRWHEQPAMAGVIKVRGCIPHITGISDVTRGTISVLGVYKKQQDGQWIKVTLAVPPGTGIGIKKVTMPTITDLLQTEKRIGEKHGHYAYIGEFWGTPGVHAPVTVRHFGDYQDGGLGEAWMGGIFGPSGSGKSVMAAKLISAYAHNPKMGILLVDPQSEFAENKTHKPGQFDMDFHAMLSSVSRGRFQPDRDILRINQICWDSRPLMVEVLRQKKFFKLIGISNPKMHEAREPLEQALDIIADKLKNGGWKRQWQDINAKPTEADLFKNAIISGMGDSYAAATRTEMISRFETNWVSQAAKLETAWNIAVDFFLPSTNKVNVETILVAALERGGIKILDLDPGKVEMSEEFRNFLLDALLTKLRNIANRNYKHRTNPTNCLVVFDEAHLFAPQTNEDGSAAGDDLAANLEKTVRTLRKMRTGFLFITQSISKIRSDIYKQLHYCFYGAGLIANDLKRLEEKDGAEAKEAYKNLPNPKQSGRYCFLINGGLVCLGTSSRPMIVEAVGGHPEFLALNAHLF